MAWDAPRRAVAFDFPGSGHSYRTGDRPDPGQHEAELMAVLHIRSAGQEVPNAATAR